MIDYFANKRDSPLHLSSAISKGIATLIIIASVVSNNNLRSLLLILGVLIFTLRLAKLPLRRVLTWGVYPVVFAAVFGIGIFFRNITTMGLADALYVPAVLMLRSLCAALSMIILLSTTPYTEIFALLKRFLPELIVNTMLLTYRFFFILIEELADMLRAIRLKGGGLNIGRILENLDNYGKIVGVLLIHSVDMSERMYGIFLVRGYRGVFSLGEELEWRRSDVYPLAIGSLIMGISLRTRGMI
jgi:cobalt/nickel transport system permease protein